MKVRKLNVICFMGSVFITVLTSLLVFSTSYYINTNAQKHSGENARGNQEYEPVMETRRNMDHGKNMRQNTVASNSQDFDVKTELQKLINDARCKPEQNILFLKTHKTGSSTITNILNRFADLNELSVAIPTDGDFRFAWPTRFHWTTVDMLRLDGEPANILCNHARYNRPEMDLIMQNNTKYITILRNPVLQFESAFYYFEYDKALKLTHHLNPLDEFLDNPDDHLYNLTIRNGDLPEAMNLIQSGMFYDLGLDFMDFDDDDNVMKAIRRLDREFDLVLIMDYFDEGLVLMKRKFCWDFDDVLYIKMNQRLQQKRNITKAMEIKIKDWNSADSMLYDYFNKTFWDEIKRQGQPFWDDLTEFRIRNKRMTEICKPREMVTKGFGIQVEVRKKVMSSKVDRYHRYFCEKMLTSETDYLSYFRKKLGYNYGYQTILIKEGMKSMTRPGELRRRLAMRQKKAAFIDLKKLLTAKDKIANNKKVVAGKESTTKETVNKKSNDKKIALHGMTAN